MNMDLTRSPKSLARTLPAAYKFNLKAIGIAQVPLHGVDLPMHLS